MLAVWRNRHAGKNKKQPSSEELAARIGTQGFLIESSSLEDVPHVAQEIVRRKPKVIAVWGGDGTLTGCLSALLPLYGRDGFPTIAVLPGGTMNVVTESLGKKELPEVKLGKLLSLLASGSELPTIRRTSIKVDERICFLFGIGLSVNFVEQYLSGEPPSPKKAFGMIGRTIRGALTGSQKAASLFAPFRASITWDGNAEPMQEWTSVSAGGVESLGFLFRPYTRVGEREGAYHLIAHNLRPLDAFWALPRMRFLGGIKNCWQEVASDVIITTEKPMTYTLEGDLFPARDRFVLSAGPVLSLVTL
jgi:diacylglycerol kinase family enzyme